MDLKEMTYWELQKLYTSISLEMIIRTWWLLFLLIVVALYLIFSEHINHWFVYTFLVGKRNKR